MRVRAVGGLSGGLGLDARAVVGRSSLVVGQNGGNGSKTDGRDARPHACLRVFGLECYRKFVGYFIHGAEGGR